MTTPLDRLIYSAAKYHKHFAMWERFLRLTTEIEIRTQVWRGYRLEEHGTPLRPDDPTLWAQHPFLMLYTPEGILPATCCRPLLTGALERSARSLGMDSVTWDLTSVLLFRKGQYDFDAVPILEQRDAPQLVFPEPQISFVHTADGWTWSLAKTGFINPMVYDDLIKSMSDRARTVLEEDTDLLASAVLLYAGGWAARIAKGGRFVQHGCKQPRVKERDGRVKKIHEIAKVGWYEFEAEKAARPQDGQAAGAPAAAAAGVAGA